MLGLLGTYVFWNTESNSAIKDALFIAVLHFAVQVIIRYICLTSKYMLVWAPAGIR